MTSQKHILLALCGITPQIITETLYGLIYQKKIPIREIWLLTTTEGREKVLPELLADGHGKFYTFCEDFNIQPDTINFNEAHILIADDISDIQTSTDNDAIANLILNFVREKTAILDSVLHCSLAGGRKTMSVYLALALQFYGRAEDKLYHVLVSPPEFENNPQFYYPPPTPRLITARDGTTLSTQAAQIDLAEVPYVHLRNKMAYLFENQRLSFDEMVQMTQQELAQMPDLPPLVVDLQRKQLLIGSQKVWLSPIEMAFYQYYAERSLSRPVDIHVKDYERYFEYPVGNFIPETSFNRILDNYRQLTSDGTVERFLNTIEKKNLDISRACQYFSRIKRKIRGAVGDDAWADYYVISGIGRYRKCYGIKLDKSKIVIVTQASGL